MREDAESRLVRGPPQEGGLIEVETRRPRRLQKDVRVVEVFQSRVQRERTPAIQRARKEIAKRSIEIQPTRAAKQIVRGEAGFELHVVHVVRRAADARAVQWCFHDLNLDALDAVAGRR